MFAGHSRLSSLESSTDNGTPVNWYKAIHVSLKKVVVEPIIESHVPACILMAAIVRGHDLNEVSNDRFNYIKDKNFRKSIVNYTFDKQ